MGSISEVMATDVVSLPASSSIVEAALAMRGADIGYIVVTQEGQPRGVLTDRDIAVRVVAEGLDPAQTTLADVASGELVCLTAEHSPSDAAKLMRELAVRRLPVIDENDRLIGVVSIGDLARELDPDSALADISASPPNN